MMKSFLLILSLIAGCEASTEDSTEVKGCRDGWVEFYCKYKENNGYQTIDVDTPEQTEIQSTQKDQWENKGRYSLYHDTKNKRLKVAIKQLQQKNFGKYKCEFEDPNSPEEVEDKFKVEAEKDGCQEQFNQTAYRTAKTTITCNYTGNEHSSSDTFFCRENNFTCEEILSTNSSVKSNGTFTLTETNRGFSVSISNVSSHDAGLYWCGVNKGNYRTGLRKIQLKVEDIRNFTRSLTIGQNFTYWCEYPNDAPIKKFICKGEDPSICQPLVNTEQQKMNNGKFSMKEDKVKRNITITVTEVTAEDSGTYWCGAESNDTRRSNTFFHRFLMTVGSSWLTVTIVVVICVVVLVLLLIVLFFYKRLHSKTTRDGEAKNNIEDRTYEEIQELPQKPDSGTALKTIYVTANFPTNPSSAPHHPSNINFQSSSGDVGGDTYFTVRDGDQHPAYSTVNHPSRSSADPFYSTVNKPQ